MVFDATRKDYNVVITAFIEVYHTYGGFPILHRLSLAVLSISFKTIIAIASIERFYLFIV